MIVGSIADTYAEGGSVKGGELTIGRLRELPADYGAEAGWFGKGESAPQVITDGSGTKDQRRGASFSLYAYTAWTDGGWVMKWLRTPA